MKTRKSIVAICIVFCMAFLISACGKVQNDGEKIPVSVKIESTDKVLLEDEVSIATNEANAAQAIIEACQAKKMAYTLNDGMFDNFDGIASTQTDGWILFINGETSDYGAKDTKVSANDMVEFRYVNYDEVFAQQ